MKTLLTIGLACTALAAGAQLPEAIKLTENEQFEKATAAFKQIVRNSPSNGEGWFYLGENYFANDQADSAEAAYLRGIEVNPNYSLNYAGVGKVLRDKGDISGAQAQFAKAGEVATLATNEAVQLHGGIGMTMEYKGGHYFKRLTMIDLMFGNADHHLRELAKAGGLQTAA